MGSFHLRILSGVLTTLTLAACAPTTQAPILDKSLVAEEAERQKDFALERIRSQRERVERVAFRILAANVDQCGKSISSDFGLYLGASAAIDKKFKEAYRRRFGMSDNVVVIAEIPGTPAAKAGIVTGDQVMGINGEAIGKERRDLAKAVKSIDTATGRREPISLTLMRDGILRNVTLTGAPICNYPVSLVEDSEVNAYADGKQIVVNTGILRMVENDVELALVIGHELGHNVMNHVNNQKIAVGLTALLEAAAGGDGSATKSVADSFSKAYSLDYEREADYVGMYYMERSGFDSTSVAGFWRRMAAENPAGIVLAKTHPPTPERFVSIEATHREILDKREHGGALLPNLKK